MPKIKINLTNDSINKLEITNIRQRIWDEKQAGLYLLVSPSGTKTYYLSYNIPGTRQRQDFKLGRHGPLTPTLARKEAQARLGEVARGIDIQAEKMSARKEAMRLKSDTLGAFIDNLYEPWAIQHKKCGKEDITRVHRNFGQWLNLPLTNISVKRITDWRTQQLKKGRVASGINRDVNSLRGVLSKAVEFEIIPESPLRKLKKLKVDQNKRIRFLCDDEEERLRDALERYDNKIRTRRSSFNQWRIERNLDPKFSS